MSHRFLFLFILVIIFSSCRKDEDLENLIRWDLKRDAYVSFNQRQVFTEAGGSVENGLIQLKDNSYLSVGTTSDEQLLLCRISEDGILTEAISSLGPGKGHAIWPRVDSEEEYCILSSHEQSSALIFVDAEGQEIGREDYFDDVDRGLLDTLKLFSVTSDGEYFYFTGFRRQQIGGRWATILKTDLNGQFVWARYYQLNAYATDIQVIGEDALVISGFWNNRAFITKVNSENGADIWTERLSPEIVGPFTELKTADDNVYLVGTIRVAGQDRVHVLSMTSNGKKGFAYTYREDNSQGHAMCLDRNNNLIVSGTLNRASDKAEQLLLCVNPSDEGGAKLIWDFPYDSNGGLTVTTVFQTADHGFISFGFTGTPGSENNYQLIKTDEEGIHREQ